MGPLTINNINLGAGHSRFFSTVPSFAIKLYTATTTVATAAPCRYFATLSDLIVRHERRFRPFDC